MKINQEKKEKIKEKGQALKDQVLRALDFVKVRDLKRAEDQELKDCQVENRHVVKSLSLKGCNQIYLLMTMEYGHKCHVTKMLKIEVTQQE